MPGIKKTGGPQQTDSAAGGVPEKKTPGTAGAPRRTAKSGTAASGAKKNRNIADAQEILEYLTGVMREGDAKDGFHAAELLGKHYSLFSDNARAEGMAVTIVNDLTR